MNIVEKAIVFATKAHSGQVRKTSSTPYILHPLEAAAIAASLTDDRDVIAAVILHDTVEDTAVTMEEIRSEFSDRVADIVMGDTENKRDELPRSASWKIRKEETLRYISSCTDEAVKILWLSDKLSNMRSFHRQHTIEGDAMWNHFNMKDKSQQEWYYRSVAELLKEFSETQAYQEYIYRVNEVFREV